jgi:hypothetical protein
MKGKISILIIIIIILALAIKIENDREKQSINESILNEKILEYLNQIADLLLEQ